MKLETLEASRCAAVEPKGLKKVDPSMVGGMVGSRESIEDQPRRLTRRNDAVEVLEKLRSREIEWTRPLRWR